MKSNCEKCGLYQQCQTPFLEGVGPLGATTALVIDTPGAASDALGVPVSGEPGQLLMRMLDEAGLPSSHVYFTHGVRCHPAKKAASVAQNKQCATFLFEELARLPNLKRIISLGAGPLKTLAGKEYAISRCRGTMLKVELPDGRKVEVLPTWAPGFIFRNPSAESEMASDFRKLKKPIGARTAVQRNYVTVDTPQSREDFLLAVQQLGPDGWMAFDIETTGLDAWADDANVVCVSFALSSDLDTAYAVPIIHSDFPATESFILDQWATCYHALHQPNGPRLVTHNGKFDVRYLMVNMGMNIVPPRWEWDTRVAAHILDENRAANQGNSLKALALVYTDLGDYSKEMRDDDAIENLRDVTWYTLCQYACADAEATLRIALAQHAEAEEQELVDLIRGVEMDKVRFCLKMELAGVDIDWARLPTVATALDEELRTQLEAIREIPEVRQLERVTHAEANAEKLRAALIRNGLPPDPDAWDAETAAKADAVMRRNPPIPEHRCQFNPNSSQQKAKLLYDYLGIRCPVTTDAGAPSVSAKAMVQIRGSLTGYQERIVGMLERITKMGKIKSTYIDPMPTYRGRDGRIRSDYQTATTVTGRLSSRSPNMQNIPRGGDDDTGSREVKQLMVAPPGYLLVACDYAQIEMRLAAIFAQDVKMVDLINHGDIHRYLASHALGVPEEEIDKETRTMAKRVNFGALYGISPHGLVGQGIPLHVAESFLDTFWREFSRFRAWSVATVKEARARGYVTGLYGHRRRLPLINSSEPGDRAEAERQAVNFPIQNAAATITNVAGGLLAEGAAAYGAEVIMQVHDSIVSRVPEDNLDEYLRFKKDVMMSRALPTILVTESDTYPKLVRIEADCQVGKNLYDLKEHEW